MNITINNKNYQVDDDNKDNILNTIPNYNITTTIAEDKRNNDIKFSNITDAWRCNVIIGLYMKVYVYALRNNKTFNDTKYIIRIHYDNKITFSVQEINDKDNLSVFDICFSDKEIANDCIKLLQEEIKRLNLEEIILKQQTLF